MWYTEIKAPPAQKKKLFESPPQASPMRQSASASSFGALVSRSRRIRGQVRRNVKIFETLHSEHIAKRRFLMAHPTSLWRLSWRVVLFCALVARIVAELRLARDESACAKDELMPRCLDRERSAGPAAGDLAFLGLAALEVVVSARTGSVDDRGRFDMRPGAAWRRYSRSGQFLVDVFLLPPWWLLGPPLRRWLAPPPKQTLPDATGFLALRVVSWLRYAPPVDGVVRWWRGAEDARLLLAAEPPAVVKRCLDDYVIPWLLGHGLERWVTFARRLPDLGDVANEYRVWRRAAYSILTSLKLVLLALAVRRAHRERLLLFDALRSRAAHRIYSALRLNAAKRRLERSRAELKRSSSSHSFASFESLEPNAVSDDDDDERSPRLPRNSRSEIPAVTPARAWIRFRDPSRTLLAALGSRRRPSVCEDIDGPGDLTPPSLMF